MSTSITIMKSERELLGKVAQYNTFNELGDQFKVCRKGGKLGMGFVRCELEGERKDVNCKSSKLLIVDGDIHSDGKTSAPCCEDVHQALMGLGYNHFIYTSHSHKNGSNKYRVVVECEEYNKSELDQLNKLLLHKLESKQIKIKYVKEMKAFSQIWFSPRRDDPEDGLFEYMSWYDGREFSKDGIENVVADNTGGAENDNTIEGMIENIRTGKEFHESMLILSYQLIKEGVPKAFVKAQLRAYMNNSIKCGEERWQKRYNEIERMVDNCKDGSKEKFDFDYKTESKVRDTGGIPRPPGLFGQLYDDAYDFLMYQYPEVAMASALGLVSGICGRKFNIDKPSPTGLNMFITIIASTGSGKDRINDFIQSALRNELKDYSGFIGPSHFYSPKAVVNSFKDNRSRVCVVSEAGLLMKVKAGNVDGLSAFILDAFQCAHSNGYTKEHSYSSVENNMESLRAMAMTVISESSPEKMLEAYSETGALDSGLLPRQLLFRIKKREIIPNMDIKSELSIGCSKRVNELLEMCMGTNGDNDPKCIKVEFEEGVMKDIFDYTVRYNRISDEAEGKSKVMQHMSTRVAQKAIRLSGIVSVFNKFRRNTDRIKIGKAEWEWSKSLCDYEFSEVTNALRGVGTDSGFGSSAGEEWDKGVGYVLGRIGELLNNRCKNQKKSLNDKQREAKVIPYSNLKFLCRGSRCIKGFDDKLSKFGNRDGYKSGLDKILDDMERKGAIERIDKVAELSNGGNGKSALNLIKIKESIAVYSSAFEDI